MRDTHQERAAFDGVELEHIPVMLAGASAPLALRLNNRATTLVRMAQDSDEPETADLYRNTSNLLVEAAQALDPPARRPWWRMWA